jgi:uncharacterized protein (TIGR01777 family)
MRVFLTGGTGFIGSALVRALLERGDECTVISRSGRSAWPGLPVRIVTADPIVAGPWQEEVGQADAVVNLAGEPIVEPPRRWTAERKRRLWISRVTTTERVAAAIKAAARPPGVLLSASAVGYYGDCGDALVHETTPPGKDFLGRLAAAWETAARAAEETTRVTLLRTGIVLGPGGGAIAPLLPLFRLGLGGPWGSGRQWWAWIHLRDQVGLMLQALDTDMAGAVNLTAPNPVTVNELAAALGRALHRPAILRAPAWALRLALGEAADALLASQRAVPGRALAAGYQFRFEKVGDALSDLI